MNYEIKEATIRLTLKEKPGLYSPVKLDNPDLIRDFIRENMADLDVENFWIVNLDNKLNALNYYVAHIGTRNGAVVDIPSVFKSAILSNASYIIIAHNHPSGDITPSDLDRVVTETIIKAGKLLQIPVLDHVIAGSSGMYYSFRENEPNLF